MKYQKPTVELVKFEETEAIMVSAAYHGLVDGSDWFVPIEPA